jgi:hypothetical protein
MAVPRSRHTSPQEQEAERKTFSIGFVYFVRASVKPLTVFTR